MKQLKSLVLAIAFIGIASGIYGQGEKQPKPLIIQTMHVNLSPETMQVNMDSLLKIWKERVMKPNPFFVSTKILKHWWGKQQPGCHFYV